VGILDGSVAFVTGAARGQGRSHALRLAEEGADILAIDICAPIETFEYGLADVDDLMSTKRDIEALGRRVIARVVDVRDAAGLRDAVVEATRQLGPIGIVVANAGVGSIGGSEPDPEQLFRDTIDVNLIGVWNTVMAAVPSMRQARSGGAIVLVSSTQGLRATGNDGSAGATAYTAAKHGVVGLMRAFANSLARDGIRVNTVHPTGVDTEMITNETVRRYFDANPQVADMAVNLLPVSLIQPADVSDAVLWLVSDQAKYVTGVTLPVDAGFTAR
jgi:SDR family mycofactocin-dependent oxidoreductase